MAAKDPRTRVSAAEEMRSLLRQLAWPSGQPPGVKAAIRRVARLTGLPPSRVRSLWYGEARRIDSDEIEIVRALARGERGDNAADQLAEEVERLKGEFARLAAEVRELRSARRDSRSS